VSQNAPAGPRALYSVGCAAAQRRVALFSPSVVEPLAMLNLSQMRSGLFVLAAACLALASRPRLARKCLTPTTRPRPDAPLAAAPYASWAHHHWVWLSSDQSNQANVTKYVLDYQAHNITVGAVDIDSEWATGNNNFVVDTTKFPDFKGLVDFVHQQDARIILWATSMVDTDSSNYAECVSKGYFIRDGLNQTTPDPLHWWHGDGVLMDYFNPEALAWWNDQLNNVLNLGVDGFKTDGTDPFIAEYLFPISAKGPVDYRQYADAYYGNFFNYSRSVNPDALIMSRPVDSYELIAGVSAFLNFSPRYAVFSGWVGDQDPTFSGLHDAMKNMIHSAWAGYVGFGSDIGGYRTGPGTLGRTAELLLRWAAVGAFSSLMENGGDKEHRPWMFDQPGSTFVVDSYRKLVAAHYELEPYLLSTGAQAWEDGGSIMNPMMPAPPDPFGIVESDNITTFQYLLGNDYLVAPVVDANVTSLNVTFPPATSGWFSVFDHSQVFPGSTSRVVPAPLGEIPAFGRQGAILPLHVSTSLMHTGDSSSFGALTFLVHTPLCDGEERTTPVRSPRHDGAWASYRCSTLPTGRKSLRFTTTPFSQDAILLVRHATPPSAAQATLAHGCTLASRTAGAFSQDSSAPLAFPYDRTGPLASNCEATVEVHSTGDIVVRRLSMQDGLDLSLTYW
jgi:hypothetical protein